MDSTPDNSPRLGIIHFLGWTACIAVAAAAHSSLMLMVHDPQAGSAVSVVLQGMEVVGNGTALGALVIWLRRRYRGLPFPMFPGEYLWLACGIERLLWLITMGVCVAIGSVGAGVVAFIAFRMMDLAVAIVFLIAAVKVRVKRWRVLLLVIAARPLLIPLAGLLFPFSWFVYFPPWFIEAPVLAIVVARDLFQRQRYPWSHWAGVAVRSWLIALGFAWRVYQWFVLP